MRTGRLILAVLLPLLTVSAISAAEPEGQEEDFEPNIISILLGVTIGGDEEGGGSENATGTLAVEYERRLTDLVGLGIFADYAGGNRREFVMGIPVFFHAGPSKFLIAPGTERNSEGDHDFLVRIGYGYEFEAGRTIIAPGIDVDFVEGETLYVIGVAVGWGF